MNDVCIVPVVKDRVVRLWDGRYGRIEIGFVYVGVGGCSMWVD